MLTLEHCYHILATLGNAFERGYQRPNTIKTAGYKIAFPLHAPVPTYLAWEQLSESIPLKLNHITGLRSSHAHINHPIKWPEAYWWPYYIGDIEKSGSLDSLTRHPGDHFDLPCPLPWRRQNTPRWWFLTIFQLLRSCAIFVRISLDIRLPYDVHIDLQKVVADIFDAFCL